MAASKFWRVVGFSAWRDGPIALAAMHLYAAGIRVDEYASLSVTGVPAQDTSVLKQADFAQQQVLLLEPSPGLAVSWTFTSEVDVNAVSFAIGVGAALEGFSIEQSDDGVAWVRKIERHGLIEPAAFVLQSVPLTTAITADLLLVSGSGSVVDVSPHQSPVSVYGSTVSAGLYGQALQFAPGAGMVYSYNPRPLPGGTYWIEAWVKPATVTGWRPIFTITAPLQGQFGALIFVITEGRLMLEVRPATGSALRSIAGGSIPANTWSHVAVSVNNGAAKLFFNGTLVASGTTVLDIAFNPSGWGLAQRLIEITLVSNILTA